jgi:hypothetical protein
LLQAPPRKICGEEEPMHEKIESPTRQLIRLQSIKFMEERLMNALEVLKQDH